MSYRGEDLDLRTPQTWSAPTEPVPATEPYGNGSRNRSATYARPGPILVDDIVLACSNHAFDVAVAHRASEVRLEHLLHAMTRIDGASHALEARGIRVAGLRRESATVIAGEIPIGLGAGQGRPRRSDDFEQVIRSASAIAYRRNAPANIDDLLDALLDMPADIPGIALLARHGGRVARDRAQRDIAREPMRERAPLPPLPSLSRASASYGNDMRDSDLRKPTTSYYTTELARDLTRPLPTDLVGTPVDGIQNARIDQLESAVRSLSSELSNERNIVGSLVQDLQRTLKTERDDTSRFRGGLHERLESLEQTLASTGSDDRNDRLEQRISELARPWGVLSDRLQALEQTLVETRDTGGEASGVHDRIAGLERTLRDIGAEASRSTSAVADRLKGMERNLDAVAARSVDLSPIANRLDIIEEAVLSPDGNQLGDKFTERLRTFEDQVKFLGTSLAAQSQGAERMQSVMADRLQAMASSLERQRADVTGPITERLNGLATALDGRMQSFAGLVERQQADFAQPILDRVTTVASAVDARGTESATLLSQATRLLSGLAERVTTLESQLALSVQKNAEAQAGHTAELKEVHEALIKLNTNQHTLAGSIDQWRLDGVGDVSVIANRLDGIEKISAKPLAMIEQLTTSVDNINRATVERYHRRNRFWYWLFGTDDWLTASWPSQVANIETERAALRGSPAGKTGSNGPAPRVQQR